MYNTWGGKLGLINQTNFSTSFYLNIPSENREVFYNKSHAMAPITYGCFEKLLEVLDFKSLPDYLKDGNRVSIFYCK